MREVEVALKRVWRWAEKSQGRNPAAKHGIRDLLEELLLLSVLLLIKPNMRKKQENRLGFKIAWDWQLLWHTFKGSQEHRLLKKRFLQFWPILVTVSGCLIFNLLKIIFLIFKNIQVTVKSILSTTVMLLRYHIKILTTAFERGGGKWSGQHNTTFYSDVVNWIPVG